MFFLVILDKAHYMLFYLAPAMYPRFLIALDENLEPLPVTVRVGQVNNIPNLARLYPLTPFPRPWMLLDKQANRGQYPVSKPTKHLCGLVQRREPNLRQRSTTHSRTTWKGLSFYRRTQVGKQRRRWSCNVVVDPVA